MVVPSSMKTRRRTTSRILVILMNGTSSVSRPRFRAPRPIILTYPFELTQQLPIAQSRFRRLDRSPADVCQPVVREFAREKSRCRQSILQGPSALLELLSRGRRRLRVLGNSRTASGRGATAEAPERRQGVTGGGAGKPATVIRLPPFVFTVLLCMMRAQIRIIVIRHGTISIHTRPDWGNRP